VYGISHPRYRAALYERFPWLACKTEGDNEDDSKSCNTTAMSDRNSEADVEETKT
jgi:r-opsin